MSDRAAMLELQRALLKLGYDLPRYGADGYWGKETRSALNAYLLAICQARPTKGRPGAQLIERVIFDAKVYKKVDVLGCDVSGWQRPRNMDWEMFWGAGGRFVYIKRSGAKVGAAQAEAHMMAIRAFNEAKGFGPDDEEYIHPGWYHFVNVKYSKKARKDAAGQSEYFFSRIMGAKDDCPEITAWRYGDLPPGIDFETNTWESRPIAGWTRQFADTLKVCMAEVGCYKVAMYGYGWALNRLRHQDFSDCWLWCGASDQVVVPKMWPMVHIKQYVKRQPWNKKKGDSRGRKTDTNYLRVPIEEYCALDKAA